MDAILIALAAEVDSLKAQLAAANAQRDELQRDNDRLALQVLDSGRNHLLTMAQRDDLLRAVVQAIEAKPPLAAADPFHGKLYMQLALLAGVAAKVADAIAKSWQPKKLTTHDDLRAAGVENHDVGRTCFHCGGDDEKKRADGLAVELSKTKSALSDAHALLAAYNAKAEQLRASVAGINAKIAAAEQGGA